MSTSLLSRAEGAFVISEYLRSEGFVEASKNFELEASYLLRELHPTKPAMNLMTILREYVVFTVLLQISKSE